MEPTQTEIAAVSYRELLQHTWNAFGLRGLVYPFTTAVVGGLLTVIVAPEAAVSSALEWKVALTTAGIIAVPWIIGAMHRGKVAALNAKLEEVAGQYLAERSEKERLTSELDRITDKMPRIEVVPDTLQANATDTVGVLRVSNHGEAANFRARFGLESGPYTPVGPSFPRNFTAVWRETSRDPVEEDYRITKGETASIWLSIVRRPEESGGDGPWLALLAVGRQTVTGSKLDTFAKTGWNPDSGEELPWIDVRLTLLSDPSGGTTPSTSLYRVGVDGLEELRRTDR